MGFSLLLQQTACLGLLLFALGASCLGSPTSVPDASSPGSPLPLRGAACLDPVLLALGMAHPRSVSVTPWLQQTWIRSVSVGLFALGIFVVCAPPRATRLVRVSAWASPIWPCVVCA